jgi:F-type H+-transporting ATPase subunit epsilon
MHLKILLPSQVFLDADHVKKMVVPTGAGFVGILPERLDFVAAVKPGIMVWQNERGDEIYTAVDDGIVVKAGDEVLCSVHRASTGTDPAKLLETIEKQFISLNTEQQAVRTTLAKLEGGLLERLSRYQHE